MTKTITDELLAKAAPDAEHYANEIIECWTEQAAPGQLMIVGCAEDMGIWADMKDAPVHLHDEIERLVRDGFRAYNATVTLCYEDLTDWYDGWETNRITEAYERSGWDVSEYIRRTLQDEVAYVQEELGCQVLPEEVWAIMTEILEDGR